MRISIQEASARLGISKHALRYYEKEGIIPPVERDGNGNRVYAESDMQWLELVCCFRDTGMPLSDVKRIVTLSRVDNHEETLDERLGILLAHREVVIAKIEEMKQHLGKIEKKINYYEAMGASCNSGSCD